MSDEPQQESPQPEEVIDYKDKYLRLLADMENTRKRMQKEKLETMRFAIDNVLADILIPMDNLENALKAAAQMAGEVKNWALGFEMILSQFKDVLQQNGVISFASEGQLFDPHLHEAVETEETDTHSEGTVLKEFVKGYRCGDRIIRPARVKVAKAKNKGE
jgi:molecular chaperone GrpE